MKQYAKSTKRKSKYLSALNPKCCGIDIGASELFVCIATSSSEQEIRSFSTFTPDLRRMADWLKANGVESIAMESTGVYWIPPYELLEEAGFEVLLVNARHLKCVPGRKTDVKDCQWIQELHSYGLLRGSFRPSNDFVELRSYVRHRSRLFESASTQVQLMHKALVQMNIQLNHAISDITGYTGLAIVQAILKGNRDPKTLAKLRHSRCKKTEEEIAQALDGNYREEHLFALKQAYEAYEFFHEQIKQCENAIKNTLEKLEQQYTSVEQDAGLQKTKRKKTAKKTDYKRSPYSFDPVPNIKKLMKVNLTDIPGIDASTAIKIMSEIGTDMSKWPNAKAFASWLGLCPGNKISGGKILSGKTKRTKNRVAQALRQSAMTLHYAKSALGAFYRKMRSRLGAPKAITATAHKLARILYRMLKDGINYEEKGENHCEQQYQNRLLKNLKKNAKELGYILIPIENSVPITNA